MSGEPDVRGWLLSLDGPLHRRGIGDRARCDTVLVDAVPCSRLAAEAYGIPVCARCFPAGPSPYGRP